MANRWTTQEETFYRDQLRHLYVIENKTIFEVSIILDISPSAVYDRLIRLGIPPQPQKKNNYLAKRSDIIIPKHYSGDLAEFFGIMMGDGNLSHFQVAVTLGSKEASYAAYIGHLMTNLFAVSPKIITDPTRGYRVVYFGSVQVSRWLKEGGLEYNKVKSQVDIPPWIFCKTIYMRRFAQGFFDTDGSVYKLKYGTQLSFTNYARPLLVSLQWLLGQLGYRVSQISGPRFYITRAVDVRRFFEEIDPHNKKHVSRFRSFLKK